MLGTSRHSFAPLDGFAHVVQSIGDILSTPVGSRVLRRDYGSRVGPMIDRPINEETRVDFIVGVAEALYRWEPRVRLDRVRFASAQADGVVALDLDVVYLEDGRSETARISL